VASVFTEIYNLGKVRQVGLMQLLDLFLLEFWKKTIILEYTF